MKRILLAVILLLFIIIGLCPWITGYYFRQNYLNLIAHYNLQHESKLTVTSYQYGWFSSQVVLKFNPFSPGPTQSNEIAETSAITLEQNITHGPFVQDKIHHTYTLAIASLHTTVHFSPKIETIIFSQPKPGGIASIESITHFNNEWINRINVIPMTLSFIGMDKTTWQGLEGTVSFKTDADLIRQLKSHFVFGELKITLEDPEQNTEFSLQSITHDTDSQHQPMGLWTGHSEIVIPAATLKTNSTLQFSMANLSFSGATNITDNMFHVASSLAIDNLNMPSQMIPVIAPLNYKLSINNLNAMELNHFITALQAARASDLANEKLTIYQTVLPRIITPTTHLNLDFYTNTSLGALTAKGMAAWPANVALPNTLDELMKNANGKIDIRIAIPLANAIIDETIDEVTTRVVQKMPETPSAASITTNKPVDTTKETFKNKLTALMQSGALPLAAAIQLMSLYDEHATPETFASSIKQLNLTTPGMEAELIQLYTQLANTPPASTLPTIPTSVQTPTSQNQIRQELSASVKSQVEQLIQQGYLIKDNNDYIASIIYENNTIRINGKDISQETKTVPATLPTN